MNGQLCPALIGFILRLLHLNNKFSKKLDQEIRNLEEKYDVPEIKISNLSEKVKNAVEFSQNLSKYWSSGSLETKRRV